MRARLTSARGRIRLSACVIACLATLSTGAGAAQSLDQSCAADTSPVRVWRGETLAQSFTPRLTTIERFDLKLSFRQAFSGPITARLHLHLPPEDAGLGIGLHTTQVTAKTTMVGAVAGAERWVSFPLRDPVRVPVAPAFPLFGIEVDPGGQSGPWGWMQCRNDYRRGQAYGRGPLVVEETRLPNPVLNVVLAGVDFQFRVHGR